jgi:hypothetical protein
MGFKGFQPGHGGSKNNFGMPPSPSLHVDDLHSAPVAAKRVRKPCAGKTKKVSVRRYPYGQSTTVSAVRMRALRAAAKIQNLGGVSSSMSSTPSTSMPSAEIDAPSAVGTSTSMLATEASQAALDEDMHNDGFRGDDARDGFRGDDVRDDFRGDDFRGDDAHDSSMVPMDPRSLTDDFEDDACCNRGVSGASTNSASANSAKGGTRQRDLHAVVSTGDGCTMGMLRDFENLPRLGLGSASQEADTEAKREKARVTTARRAAEQKAELDLHKITDAQTPPRAPSKCFINDAIASVTECKICLERAKEPMYFTTCKCPQIICKACAAKSKDKENKCVFCRNENPFRRIESIHAAFVCVIEGADTCCFFAPFTSDGRRTVPTFSCVQSFYVITTPGCHNGEMSTFC